MWYPRIFDASSKSVCLKCFWSSDKSRTRSKNIFFVDYWKFFLAQTVFIYLTQTLCASQLGFSVTEIKVGAEPFEHFIFGSNLVECRCAFLYCFVLGTVHFLQYKKSTTMWGRIVFVFENYVADCSRGSRTFYCPDAGRRRRDVTTKNNHFKPVNSAHVSFGRPKHPTIRINWKRPRTRPGVRLTTTFSRGLNKITAGTNDARVYRENGTPLDRWTRSFVSRNVNNDGSMHGP